MKPPQLFPGTHISLSAVVTSRSWDPLAVFKTTSLSKKTRGLCQEHLFLVCVCVCAHVAGASLVCMCVCARVAFVHMRVCACRLFGTISSESWGRKWQPLQCSCLENPRDRGAWWAAIYGVAQSRTRLKRLSSSSSQWVLPAHLPGTSSELKLAEML